MCEFGGHFQCVNLGVILNVYDFGGHSQCVNLGVILSA